MFRIQKNVIRFITVEIQTHVEIYLRSKNSISSIKTYYHLSYAWFNTKINSNQNLMSTFFFMAQQPHWALASSLLRFWYHTQAQHAQSDSYGRVIGPSHRPVPDKTQHSRDTSMPPAGFETYIPASQRPHTRVLDCAAIGIHTRQKYNFHQPS